MPDQGVLNMWLQNRHNKVAKGMTYTGWRSNHQNRSSRGTKPNFSAVIALTVRGTTDRLNGMTLYTTKAACPACGCKSGKLVLTSSGKTRLRAIVKRYALQFPHLRERFGKYLS